MAFVYPIGIPVGMLLVMKHKVIGKEDYYTVVKTYGFLYKDFHIDCWYWGILNLMRKLALSGMLIFFSRGSVAQVPRSAPHRCLAWYLCERMCDRAVHPKLAARFAYMGVLDTHAHTWVAPTYMSWKRA